MRATTWTMALAALLWTGSAWAQNAAAGTAAQDPLRDRDRVRDPPTHDGDGMPDRLREQARDRMHEAMAEHATLPVNAPEMQGHADAARERARDRARLHEAEALRAAERHAQRTHGGDAAATHHDGAGPHGPGNEAGGCTGEGSDAAEHHRDMEMHGGSMGGHGDGGSGGMDGGGMHGGH